MARAAGAPRYAVRSSNRGVAALAFASNGATSLWLANLTDETQRVTLPARRGATAAILDETTAATRRRRRAFLLAPATKLASRHLELGAFGVAHIRDRGWIMTASTSFDPGPNARFIGVKGSRVGPEHAGAAARPRCARAQHRPRWRALPGGRRERPAAQQGRKSIAIVRRQIAAGAIGICCTTIGEAEVMAGRRHRQRPDHVADRDAADDRPADRPQRNRPTGLIVVVDDPRECRRAGRRRSARPASRSAILVEFDVGQGRTGVDRRGQRGRAVAPGQGDRRISSIAASRPITAISSTWRPMPIAKRRPRRQMARVRATCWRV